MRSIEMSYYNVYYYCNIIDNLLHLFTTSIDWASTAAQFKDWFYEDDNIENFPKYSALHSFLDYAIRKLISEEDERELEVLQERYDDEHAITLNPDQRLRYAFASEYKFEHRLWIDRLLHNYGSGNECFYRYLKGKTIKYMDDEYSEFCFLNGEYDEAVFKLSRELFYVLFQNRDFLHRFNDYLSSPEKRFDRCNIPSWVKRSVKFRDRGKCVCCGKDISGLLDVEDDNSVHYDHMISLNDGGLNDISNIQLMCRSCNLKKSSGSFTNTKYSDWYDFEN